MVPAFQGIGRLMRGLGLGLSAICVALASLAPSTLAAPMGWGAADAQMIPGGLPLLAASPLPSHSPLVLGASPIPSHSSTPSPSAQGSETNSIRVLASSMPRPVLHQEIVAPHAPLSASVAPLGHWEAPIWDPGMAMAMRSVPVGYSSLGQALVFLPDPGIVPLLVERERPASLVLRLPHGHRWAPGLPGETWPVRGAMGPVAQVQVSQDGQELVVRFVGARPRYTLLPASDGRLAIAFGSVDAAAAALAASPRPLPSPLPASPSPTPSILITPEPVPWRSGAPLASPSPGLVVLASPAASAPLPEATPSRPTPVPLVVVTPPPLPQLPAAWPSEAAPLLAGRLHLQGDLAMALQEQLPADGLDARADWVPGARLRWEPLLSPKVGMVAQLTGMGVKYRHSQLTPLGLEALLARDAYDLNLGLLGRLPLPAGLEFAASPGLLVRIQRAQASAGRPGALLPYTSSAWRDASSFSYGGLLALSAGWRIWDAMALVLQAEGYGLAAGLAEPSGGLRPYPLLGLRAEAQWRLSLGPLGLSAAYVVVEELAADTDTTRNLTRRWSGPSLGLGLQF